MKNLIVFVAVGLLKTSAFGALVLTINQGDQTLSITGSDSGTLISGGSFAVVDWAIDTGITSTDLGFLSETAIIGPGAVNQAQFRISGTGAWFRATETPVPGGAVTFTGSGETFSYSGYDAPSISYLESLTDSDSMSRISGSGFSPMAINVVPEPSSLVYLAAFSTGLMFSRRRKRL